MAIDESIKLEDVSKLRDRLLEEKVTAKNQQTRREEAVDKVKKALGKIPEGVIEELRNSGLVLDSVISPDFEKLKSDKEYLEQYKVDSMKLISTISERLKALLK